MNLLRDPLAGVVVAVLAGMAVGGERQRSGHASGPDARLGGVRTFTLLGTSAGIAGFLLVIGHAIRVAGGVVILDATLLPALLKLLVPSLIVSAVALAFAWHSLGRATVVPTPLKNPLQLRAAIEMALMFQGEGNSAPPGSFPRDGRGRPLVPR